MTTAEHKSDFELTKYIPYLALLGELWDVFCENFWKKWLHYNGTALYLVMSTVQCFTLFDDHVWFANVSRAHIYCQVWWTLWIRYEGSPWPCCQGTQVWYHVKCEMISVGFLNRFLILLSIKPVALDSYGNDNRTHWEDSTLMVVCSDSKVHMAHVGPPGSCRPPVGPMLAPWTLLSGCIFNVWK